jgi:hypothetical protein
MDKKKMHADRERFTQILFTSQLPNRPEDKAGKKIDNVET